MKRFKIFVLALLTLPLRITTVHGQVGFDIRKGTVTASSFVANGAGFVGNGAGLTNLSTATSPGETSYFGSEKTFGSSVTIKGTDASGYSLKAVTGASGGGILIQSPNGSPAAVLLSTGPADPLRGGIALFKSFDPSFPASRIGDYGLCMGDILGVENILCADATMNDFFLNQSIVGYSSITASAFFGDGSHLTGIAGGGETGYFAGTKTFGSSVTISGAGLKIGDGTGLTEEYIRGGLNAAEGPHLGFVSGAGVNAQTVGAIGSHGALFGVTDTTMTIYGSQGLILGVSAGEAMFMQYNVSGRAFTGMGTENPAALLHLSSGTMILDGTGAPTVNQALCLDGGGKLGHCTSVVGVGGGCTCSAP